MKGHSSPPTDGFQSFDDLNSGARLDDDGETFDLSKYMAAIRRRWALLVACCILAGSFALIRHALTEKQYESTVTIQIERKRLSLLALGQAGWLEDWWNMEYYPTQYRLLRSRGMAERVVLNLRLHQDPNFNPRAAALLPGSDQQASTSSAELANLASRVRSGLTVNPIEETQLVEMSYRSNSPELAARIANAYAEVFIEWGIENRSSTVGQASTMMNAQIESLRNEIDERERQLNAYASSGDFALDPDGQALIDRRQTISRQYNEVVGERALKEAAYRGLANLPKDAAVASANDSVVGALRSELFALEAEYNSKLDTFTPEWPEMVQLKSQIGDKREQLDRLVDDSASEARDQAYAEFQKVKRQEESLKAELERMAVDARLQNSEALEYINRKNYIDSRNETLNDLIKRQSETEIASRVQTSRESNVRIVDRAVVPGSPYAPVLKGDLTKALALGGMLGMAIIFLLEFMDRTIKTPEELEALTHLPTLAVIPDLNSSGSSYGGRFGSKGYNYGYGYAYGGKRRKKDSAAAGDQDKGGKIELLPHSQPRLAVSEAYRSLRTALLLSSTEKLQVVAVTSAEPGEGKTATTVNLAVVMAQLGRRVLVIDADLRRPRMHKVFDLSNRLGLVNYLTSDVDLNQLFHQSEVPNMWVCTSGPIPPNPSELLASDRMREFLAAVSQRFDFILIDTPPILPVVDAVILGTRADGVIVCVRAGALVREHAKYCRERLNYADLRIFGTVLNRYRTSAGGYNKKYRYYGVYEETTPESRSDAA